jgi:hypothetical protein
MSIGPGTCWPEREYSIFLRNRTIPDIAPTSSPGGGICQSAIVHPLKVSDNEWFFGAFVIDRKIQMKMKLYINGVLVDEKLENYSTLYKASGDLLIGNYESGYVHTVPFLGVLDDIRIYNRALSKDEIIHLSKN